MTKRTTIPDSLFGKHWFTAATTGVPLYISTTAGSGVMMKKELGYQYRHFLYRVVNGYTQMNYDRDDLARLWRIIMDKIARKPNYLRDLRTRYRRTVRRHGAFLKNITPKNLKRSSDARLLSMFRRAAIAQADSVGIGHICETIGIHGEGVFYDLLNRAMPGSKKATIAALTTTLTAPRKESFLRREERELLAVDLLRGAARAEALRAHVKKYSWIRNTYAGPVISDAAYFTAHLFTIRTEQQPHAKKRRLITHSLPPAITMLANAISFVTAWQDERKENILRTISFLGIIAHEIAGRTEIPLHAIHNLGLRDVLALNNRTQLKAMEQELRRRARGCFILQEPRREIVVSGATFTALNRRYEQMLKRNKGNESSLYGTVANPGRAVGRVVICQMPKDISRVRRGDIIVASMTRPEIMPAVKKASAIVTDEGGITCHAAIVSRELGIPCIIGTKVATSTLREGDRVEVNANHGVVKKLL